MTNLRHFLARRGPIPRPALYISGITILLLGAALALLPRLRNEPPVSALTATQPAASPAAGDAQEPPAALAVKIYTTEEGMQQIKAAELKKTGFDIEKADLAQLVMLHDGRAQPFWMEGEGKDRVVRFYAKASHSTYTAEAVYWLAEKSAALDALAVEQSEAPAAAPADLPDVPPDAHFTAVRLEQNLVYNPQVETGEHWLWVSLPAPKSQDFEIDLDSPLDGEARLTLEVWASTEGAAKPDHHLVVRVNGQAAADEAWDGKGRRTITAKLPAGLLQAGKNVISIEAPGDTGVAADITFVDWIEVGYPRKFEAQEDRLEFTSPGRLHTLKGFSGAVQVYDVSDPDGAIKVETAGEPASFEGQAGHRYISVGPKGWRRAARLELASLNPSLRAPAGADYIAIGPPDLLAAAKPLLDWREKNGLQVMAVPAQAVYDQFGWGSPEPQSIRAFLQYAAQYWQPAPGYLLLLGDASYDPKGYLAPAEANRLPTFLTPTVFGGETASDVLFTQLDEDSLPDLAVGRLPARTEEQVSVYAAKLLAYEGGAAPQEWIGRVLAVADGQDAAFRGDAQAFLDLFPQEYTTELLSPDAGASDANEVILGRLNQGDLIVGYFGHGSINMWGKDKLFTNEDAARLDNAGRLPVVINMTCLTGLFTHPKMESLAEALLWRPNAGAAAVLAATSLTLPSDQSFLSRALVEAIFAHRDASLGKALLEARRSVSWETEGARDVLETFLLFGDPALKLPLQ